MAAARRPVPPGERGRGERRPAPTVARKARKETMVARQATLKKGYKIKLNNLGKK